MKIAIAVPGISLEGGGPSRSVVALGEAMIPYHSDIWLLTEPVRNHDKDVSTSLPRLFWHKGEIEDPSGIKFQLDQTSIIILNGLWLPFNHQLSCFAAKNQIPIIWTPRGTLAPWALKHKWLKKKIAWHVYQQRDLESCQGFHATSEQEADWIRNLGFHQPIAILPNGVFFIANDNDDFSDNRSVKERDLPKSQEAKLSLTNNGVSATHCESCFKSQGSLQATPTFDKQIAVYLGRFHKVKGLPNLLEAWDRVRPDGWQLVLAGHDDDGHLSLLKKIIQKKNLSDTVHIRGPCYGEEKKNFLQNADLFILPSFTENFGIVVAEALSYGVPVLTTTGTPWKELETHKCGWLVEPTADGIESGIRRALSTSHTERAAMGKRGRSLIEQKYLWPSIATKMLEYYRWMISGGEKPDFVL